MEMLSLGSLVVAARGALRSTEVAMAGRSQLLVLGYAGRRLKKGGTIFAAALTSSRGGDVR
jgi:hypothetical protein